MITKLSLEEIIIILIMSKSIIVNCYKTKNDLIFKSFQVIIELKAFYIFNRLFVLCDCFQYEPTAFIS